MSDRSRTIDRHHSLLDVTQQLDTERPVVVGGANSSVYLGGLEYEASLLGQIRNRVEGRCGHGELGTVAHRGGLVNLGHVLRRPESTISALVIDDRLDEGMSVEVGPENSGKMELGIGRLPEQEIGETMLT